MQVAYKEPLTLLWCQTGDHCSLKQPSLPISSKIQLPRRQKDTFTAHNIKKCIYIFKKHLMKNRRLLQDETV